MVIDPKYADDISFIRTDETKMNRVKRLLPDLLKKGNLTENESKREEFRISDVKDTEPHINRRKDLTINTMKTLEPLTKLHNLFKDYVQGVLLYNSELWTTTKTIADRIDSFPSKEHKIK